MAAIDTVTSDASTSAERRPFLESGWAIALLALLILGVLGWRFVADPSLSAPTRDPAWYTWRAQVIMDSDPASVVGEWGPLVGDAKAGLFSGGYRVTTLVGGAMLQQVAGIDKYSFSAFLMLGIPILTGLAFGAGAFRSRKHWLVAGLSLLAAAAFFLTTPYVGYLDNITVLFLLSLLFPFLQASRTSWGARGALFLTGIAAAFTHPTTCVLFGLTMMAVFGFHVLTARLRLSKALKSDGPALMSVGFGMIVGLACWVIGIWGAGANLSDAALPPPYTKKFFVERLGSWVLSMQPQITVPLAVFAVASTILLARRERRPADLYDVHAAWWMFPFLGILTFFLGTDYQVAGADGSPVVPYYRFMNATAAPMALTGLGAFAVVMWFFSKDEKKPRDAVLTGGALLVWSIGWIGLGGLSGGAIAAMAAFAVLAVLVIARPFLRRGLMPTVAAWVAAVVVVGSLGWMLLYGTRPSNWVSEQTQWANQGVRTSLAAVHEIVASAGDRPNVLVMNYNDTDDPADRTNTAYGWAKTFTNVFRTGLPGQDAIKSATYLGTVKNFMQGVETTGPSEGYNRASREHFAALQLREEQYPQPPVAFVIGQYYKGLCNGGACGDDPANDERVLQDALVAGNATEVGPDVYVLTGDGLWTPPADVIARAEGASQAEAAKFEDHPGAFADPLHLLRVLFGLFVLAILPGLLAVRFFEIDDSPLVTVSLVPGLSVVLTLLSGIGILAVWRGPLTEPKAWVAAGVAVGIGAVLGFAKQRILAPLDSFAGFFDKLFAQFLVQAGQGVVQGAIAKSLAFGGQQGFDVQNLPSAKYLLTVVLFLYGPYTLLSPFVGVFIDRFPRRRVVWWTTLITAVVVTAVAVLVLLPLGSGTTEGRVGATAALIVGLLAVQACTRVALAVKSAAIPDVLSGKDLLSGNGLSQAGGGFFQIVGIAFGTGLAGFVPPWIPVVIGAVVLIVGGVVAKQLRHAEVHRHDSTFGQEVSRVLRDIVAGLKEVASRPAAALGLSSFQMLRYQFWGFGLFVFGLYGKNLVKGGDADTLSLVLSGIGGLLGGVLGVIVAQKLKDKVPPVRLLVVSMVLLGIGTLVGGLLVSVAGFALMLFMGFFSFFLGKISADTITQQAMPDDFRGRAFALFDIAYNLGYIVPALILFLVWGDGSSASTRLILLGSGVVFLILTALVAGWAGRIRDEFAPQDDLVGEEAAELLTAD
jgi:MFS family permease